VVTPDYGNEFTIKTGTRLEIGDEAHFPFPYDTSCFAKVRGFIDVGLTDTFGRAHWVP
jgi:hypothetical protein